jgi:hypothetical protein
VGDGEMFTLETIEPGHLADRQATKPSGKVTLVPVA